MGISADFKDMAMDLAATLTAEEIAAVTGCSRTEALSKLLSSDIGESLYDDSLKLWWESPADIAQAFLENRPVCCT